MFLFWSRSTLCSLVRFVWAAAQTKRLKAGTPPGLHLWFGELNPWCLRVNGKPPPEHLQLTKPNHQLEGSDEHSARRAPVHRGEVSSRPPGPRSGEEEAPPDGVFPYPKSLTKKQQFRDGWGGGWGGYFEGDL